VAIPPSLKIVLGAGIPTLPQILNDEHTDEKAVINTYAKKALKPAP